MNRGGERSGRRWSGQFTFTVMTSDMRGGSEQMIRQVAQHQLERVFSRRQFNTRLGLSGAEMKMFLVLWDRFIRIQ